MPNRGKALALALVVLILAGIVYERVGERLDRRRFPRGGHSVDMGGRTLNVDCSGEGSPAVIFVSGASGTGDGWQSIQNRIKTLTRACWYDRAGLGWSDPGPMPLTAQASAEDLHELLRRINVPPPYILVGHSFGGAIVRVYTGLYPGDVAGVVLVDSMQEGQMRYSPSKIFGVLANYPQRIQPLACALVPVVFPVLRVLGILRLAIQFSKQKLSLTLQPKTIVTSASEGCNWEEDIRELRAAGTLGDRPLAVLTAGMTGSSPDPRVQAAIDAYHDLWVHEFQPDLAKLSSRGTQEVIQYDHHGIPAEAPEAVVASVDEMVEDLREKR